MAEFTIVTTKRGYVAKQQGKQVASLTSKEEEFVEFDSMGNLWLLAETETVQKGHQDTNKKDEEQQNDQITNKEGNSFATRKKNSSSFINGKLMATY